ncbi:MAG TPA: metalloregulator ArsR/SmtB family transcription factor [Gemmatimonadaceae bacterium]|nr:metalloregulator ArsR/SmtB family transcription factor [Gemmatimonadaceae bacterium]
MKTAEAVKALAALAQDTRLAIYRLLVQQGPEGLPAGTIAERLNVPAATLSFHLKELTNAGMIGPRQDGRFVYYSANYERMNDLLGYLSENCCQGESATACAPRVQLRRRRA